MRTEEVHDWLSKLNCLNLLDVIKPTGMKKKTNFQKILGYLFLVPALITMLPYIMGSIVLFYNQMLYRNSEGFRYMPGLNPENIFDSYFPIYIGLMALSGSYLIKDKFSDK